jgi:hypothetical protein
MDWMIRGSIPLMSKILSFSTKRLESPVEWVPDVLCRWVKRSERELDQSSPFNAELKKHWGYTSILHLQLWRGVQTGNLTLNYYYYYYYYYSVKYM